MGVNSCEAGRTGEENKLTAAGPDCAGRVVQTIVRKSSPVFS